MPPSIDLKRTTLPELFGFLRNLSLGSYAVIAGLIVGVFSIGVFVKELGKGSDDTQRHELEQSALQLTEELNRSKLDLQMRSMELDQQKKEKLDLLNKYEADHSRQQLLLDSADAGMTDALTTKGKLEEKIRSLEASQSLQQRKEKEQQNELLLARKTITELSKLRERENKKSDELLAENLDLQLKLANRDAQQTFGFLSENWAYVIWAADSPNMPPIYIDNMHYTLFKCLRKILPSDLLGRVGAKAASFSVRSEKTVLFNVPHLYIIPIQEGEHRFTRQTASSHPPTYDATTKVTAKTVHFVDIEQVEIYGDDQETRIKLRTLDQYQVAREIPRKILSSMREDNECLMGR